MILGLFWGSIVSLPFLLWRVIAKRRWWIAAAMLAGAIAVGSAASAMVSQFLHVDRGAVLLLLLWSAAGAGSAGLLCFGAGAVWRALRRA